MKIALTHGATLARQERGKTGQGNRGPGLGRGISPYESMSIYDYIGFDEKPEIEKKVRNDKAEEATVLIVGENRGNRNYFKYVVERFGLRAVSAGREERASELLQNNSVACLLVDIDAEKGISGVNPLRWAERNDPLKRIPLIGVTSKRMKGGPRVELLKKTFDDYVAGPFKFKKFQKAFTRNLIKL